MKALGNKIYIQRGESFVVKFGAHNIAPLVIKNSYEYPFIIVMLKSTQYKQFDQYISMRWLDCKNVLKFDNNNIMHLGVSTINNAIIPNDDNGFKRVYSVSDINGILTYFYYTGSNRKEYSFAFAVAYDNDESNEFVDREYIGEVHLIDGKTTASYLYELCDKYNLILSEKTMLNAYNALLSIKASELATFTVNNPIYIKTSSLLLCKFNLFSEV